MVCNAAAASAASAAMGAWQAQTLYGESDVVGCAKMPLQMRLLFRPAQHC
jgi:hypothetical protein